MVNKKVLLGVAIVGLSTLLAVNANAAVPGAYVGGTLGWGDVHQGGFDSDDFFTSTSERDTGIAGRLFAGYQFDDTFGAELGWSKFKNVNAHASYEDFFYAGNASATVKTNAFDLVGKATLPLQNNFSVFGKAGVAYLTERADVNLSGADFAVHGSGTEHKVYPTFTVGAAYDFAPNVVGDISWNRIQKVGTSSTLASTDLVGAGISYYFG